MSFARISAASVIALSMLAMSPAQDGDRHKINELERKVAELERRIRALETQLNNVPIARAGGTTVTKHHLNLAREVDAIRSGGAKTEAAVLLDLLECAAHREMLHRLGILLTADEIVADHERLEKDIFSAKMHTLLDPYSGMYDHLLVIPGLAASKLRVTFQTDKRANQGAWDQADALLKRALIDPGAIAAVGRDKSGEYRRMDTRSLSGAQQTWAKAFEAKYLDPLRDGQVLNQIVDSDEGFYVARLIDSRKHSVSFEYVLFRKGTFETWVRDQLKGIEVDIMDSGLRQDLMGRPAGHPVCDRLAGR